MKATRRQLLAGTAAGIALTALGPIGTGTAAAQGAGVLRVSVNQRVNTLNPLKMVNIPEAMVAELIYSTVTRLGPNMVPEPGLATKWESNRDASEWTFTLRDGVKFHDGTPFGAKDVVATIKAILDPKTGSPGAKQIGPIKDVSVSDERTVKFVLTTPFADLPVALAQWNASIVPAAVLEKDPTLLESGKYGCGPFKLANYEPGRIIRVERYENYHVPQHPKVAAVEQIIYPDLTAESAAIINGETDILLVATPADFDRLEKASGVVGVRQPSGRFLNLVLRMDQKPFDDIRVRKALQLSMDREALVEVVLEGKGRPAFDNPISPGYRYHADTPAIPYDPDKARELLREAGHPNGLKVPLYVANRPAVRNALAVALKEMAQPAGFDIDVQIVPYDAYLANIWRKANFYIGSFPMQSTEDAMFTLLFTTDAPWNDSQWNNAKFDGLVQEARRTPDPERRKALYTEAQRMMVDEVPYIIPIYEDLLAAHRSYVKDFRVHPRHGSFRLDEVSLGEGAPSRT